MRRKTEPLLCELHAHTTWSDGALSLTELVDLYGRAGFDVLAVTDHVNRTDDPLLPPGTKPRGVKARDHRWELFNRYDLFGWVAQRGLPAVASGDFHRPEHLYGWKTLLPCAKEAAAVVAYLRSARPAFLTRIDPAVELPRAA